MYVRRKLESLYKKNMMLRAMIIKLKESISRNDGIVDVRRLDILVQVALEAKEKQVVQEPPIKEGEVNMKRVIKRSRRNRNLG